MVNHQDMHKTVWKFKEVSNSVKNRHEQWENNKDTLKELLESIKNQEILEILDEDYSANITENNDIITLKLSNNYLEGQLNYELLYNGKIKIYTTFPEIKDEEGESKKVYINTYNPNEINEMNTIDDLNSFFMNFKSNISSIHR